MAGFAIQARREFWSGGDQPVNYSTPEQVGGLGKFLLGVGAFGASGYIPTKRGRVWDYYIRAIRAIEEYSPGQVLRTFELSRMLGPLETAARAPRFYSSELLAELGTTREGRAWIDYHSKLIGRNLRAEEEFITQGFRYEGGRLLLGQTGEEVLLRHAGIIRNLSLTDPRFQASCARSLLGGPWAAGRGAFTARIPFISEAGERLTEAHMFVGGQTRAQAAGRYLFGYGTSLIERFNRLVRGDIPVVSSILKHIPILNKFSFGVTPSSGLKTLGKLTLKLGIGLPMALLAYQQLDYFARRSEIFNQTVFGEGITAGIATMWTRGQVAASEVAETLGLHRYREWQEEIAPGSTSLAKLAAFPIIGGLGGIGIGYAHRIASQLSSQLTDKITSQEASVVYSAAQKFLAEKLTGRQVETEFLRTLSVPLRELAETRAEKWAEGTVGRLVSIGNRMLLGKGKGLGTLSRALGLGGLLGGILAVSPFIPGALVPSERPDELRKIYSGEKDVPIRRGRWWMFGRSLWEGERPIAYVPHWYPRLMSRAREKAIWGEKGDEEISPLEKWYIKNMTYELEKEHYFSRPYPVTSPAGHEMPILGPLVSATIGEWVKPRMYMHGSEWMREGGEGIEYRNMPLRWGEMEPQLELGELPPGAPVSRADVKQVIGEQLFYFQQIIGLPGFVMSSIKEAVTGTPGIGDEEMRLAEAGTMYGYKRKYWEQEIGDPGGITEAFRRLYPRERRIPEYNPIPNAFADVEWLPGEGEKSINFKVGDPFAAIPHGDIRLPGIGFETLHPEVAGLEPNEYPDIWRLKILGDVAPYTDKYQHALAQVQARRTRGELTDKEEEMYQAILAQVVTVKQGKEFTPYKYKERVLTPAEEVLARVNESIKGGAPEVAGPARMLGSYWETLAHGIETPFEYLTPLSPGAKLVHSRTAIEDYERTNLYGSESAFWQHPIRDFIKPFVSSAAHALGWEGIPEDEEQRRSIESYFDALKYIKFTRLKTMAQMAGEGKLAAEFEEQRRETLVGADPYTRQYAHIFRALPRRERDYFNEFVKADKEEREKILEMIPENERSLLMARWEMEDVANWRNAIKEEAPMSEEEKELAAKQSEELWRRKETEGFPTDEELFREYQETRLPYESYADWYRRTRILPELLKGKNIPGPDWVGMDPRVRLQDVKLKVVESIGGSPFDYDIWPDDVRVAARKPYLDEAASQLKVTGGMDLEEVKSRVNDLLGSNGITPISISSKPIYGETGNVIDITIEQDRTEDVRAVIRREGLN